MGVVGKDYGNHALPGWRGGTVGYHVDDGKIFDAANPTKGVEYEGKWLLLHITCTIVESYGSLSRRICCFTDHLVLLL